jgi:uncharacterized membrane protein
VDVLTLVNLLFAGLLAGAELTVRLGVRDPIATLDELPQLRLRQALIRPLRVLVPCLFVPTLLSGVVLVVIDGGWLRVAGLVAIAVWTAVTFLGTVPINSAIVDWDAAAPPADWRERVWRWERLDTARAVAALAAFVFFLLSIGSVG